MSQIDKTKIVLTFRKGNITHTRTGLDKKLPLEISYVGYARFFFCGVMRCNEPNAAMEPLACHLSF